MLIFTSIACEKVKPFDMIWSKSRDVVQLHLQCDSECDAIEHRNIGEECDFLEHSLVECDVLVLLVKSVIFALYIQCDAIYKQIIDFY